MKLRRLHTIVGLTLLLPILGWIITALVFYIKPGYGEAYALLEPKTYPMDAGVSIRTDSSWLEFRCVRTILGNHLIVRTSRGWSQLDPLTLLPRAKPTDGELRMLLMDAMGANPSRYGEISAISNDTIITNTGIRIILNWDRLSLDQKGRDTDRIDALYRIHYLQWTGIPAVDKILGPAGLALVMILSILGVRLALTSEKNRGRISE